MKVLADSSVIINSLRGVKTPASRRFDRMMTSASLPAITPDIYQEVLQGAADAQYFARLREQLQRLPMVEPADVYNTRSQAAWLYASLRWRGVTVRSTIDCLIAITAIEHDLSLLQDDQDYERIARAEPRLKLA